MQTLDHELLEAHARGDKFALVRLYGRAAKEAVEEDARYFYLTHAYIFALDCGADEARAIYNALHEAGRI